MWHWLTRRLWRRPAPEMLLVVMRLDHMLRMHPQMDRSHVCARCGEPVGIYPSGQAVLKHYPQTTIICSVCRPPAAQDRLAPGAVEESQHSVWRTP